MASAALAGEPPPQPIDVQLEVRINGQPTRLIGAFTLDTKNRLSSTRAELAALGIAVPGSGEAEAKVELDTVPGLSYRYDDIGQTVDIAAPDRLRLAKTYSALAAPAAPEAESGTGLLVNYTAYSGASHDFSRASSAINGGSLALDARAYSPKGTLSQSGLAGTTTFADATALRLDTMWSYADEADARSYRAGDVTTGGLAWTRPIRMGGAQVQRNFALRPDLITLPLPGFSGSAALPSTVDIYIDNVKTFSQQVDPGPFHIDNLPVITGNGTARVVVTDSSGRQTAQDQSFLVSPDLLRKGIFDYSLDAGVARYGYGTSSFDYGSAPLASASLRYGVSDRLTAEVHGEAGGGLVNGGAGVVFGAGELGQFSAALAASQHEGERGLLLYAGWTDDIGNFSISASARRSFAHYDDLATITAKPDAAGASLALTADARAVEQLDLSYGFPASKMGAGLGLVHVEDGHGKHTLLGSGSLSKSFDSSLSLFASGFYDFLGNGGFGAFAGLSYNFGGGLSASASSSYGKDGLTASASLAKPMDGSAGSTGWRLSKGMGQNSYAAADGSYLGSMGLIQGAAYQQGSAANLNFSLDGALVAADGGVFLGTRIDDGFAVVDAGSPGVPVKLENRPAGITRGDGKLLVSGLKSYQANKISLDVAKLPVMADIPRTETYATPREGSGVTVSFGITTHASAAIVVITDPQGEPLPAGSSVSLAGQPDPFVVCFDGEVYMTGLGPLNRFESTAGQVACSGQFRFAPSTDEQQKLGPVACN